MLKKRHINWLLSFVFLFAVSCGEKQKSKPVELDAPVAEKAQDVVFGEADAAHTIFMYASYQCDYCRYFFSRTYPQLKADYLDKGKLKLVVKWLDFGQRPQMLKALQAASCISHFGVYDKFHKLLVVNPDVIFTAKFDELVDDIMMHNDLIAECMLDNDNYAYLKENVQEFRALKLTGTPTFVFNNRAYTGYFAPDNFEKIIDKEFKF